tara:strand:+ start:145 stop:579 length:435 start_codon:yes stop_codon:yes gene_type:complete
MAHFAKLDENNIVTQVIVVSNDDCIDPHTGQEDELIGSAFCRKLLGGEWKQTSYNNNMRGNYAGIGYTYMSNVATMGVASTDIFIAQQPYPSWTVGVNTARWYSPLGDAPTLSESDQKTKYYVWDEDAYQADNSTGWVLTNKPD